MVDGDYNDPIGFRPIIHRVGEALCQDVPDGLIDGGLLNAVENKLDFGQELLSQAGTSTLVLRAALIDLIPDFRLEDQWAVYR